MKTQYGDLPIEMNGSTGRARLVSGGDVRSHTKVGMKFDQKKPHPTSSPVGSEKQNRLDGAGSNPAPAPIDAYDSKLEQARATYLGYLLLAKDLTRVVHHPFSVELAPKRWYTPDFLIEFPDGRLQVEEIKGHLKQKNARDSITRLHLAAAKLPMFDWRLTMRIRGQWEERCIPTNR